MKQLIKNRTILVKVLQKIEATKQLLNIPYEGEPEQLDLRFIDNAIGIYQLSIGAYNKKIKKLKGVKV